MKLPESEHAVARERIIRLFAYLSELQRLRTPPKIHVKSYNWRLTIGDVPTAPEVAVGVILPPDEEGQSEGDDFILKVRKPDSDKGPVADLFEKLLELHSIIERESEKVELVLGDGVLLLQTTEGTVEHPLLLQKLQLEFVPETPEFIFRETDREPFLYSPLLRWCGFEEGDVSAVRQELQLAACHPLGGEETTHFLHSLQEKLWPEGKFLEAGEDPGKPSKTPRLMRAAQIYLGPRNLGFAQAIDSFLELVPGMEELPDSLVRIIGVEPPAPTPTTAELEPLLTMPANPEQERVARRLAETGAVLVQGPPGTGKTHTIANLIGHLLAQGKSVLVTSHASKALRVVRDMVIPELRPLCVSVLDQEQESRDQLEEAVKGIVARFTTSDTEEMEQLAQTYAERRKELEQRLAETREKLLAARQDEYRDIKVGETLVHPARAARRVARGAGVHDWIPGPVTQGAALSLTPEEVEELYRLNREVPPELEADLNTRLPELRQLVPEGEFRELVSRKAGLRSSEPAKGDEVWLNQNQSPAVLNRLVEQGDRVASSIIAGRDWALECMRVGGMEGAHRDNWEDLITILEASYAEVAELNRQVLSSGASVDVDLPPQTQMQVCTEILEHLKAKKSVGFFELQFKRHWRTFLLGSQLNGSPPETVEDCEALMAYLRLKSKREALRIRWDRQMATKGAPPFDQLGEQPEEVCRQYVEALRGALSWHDRVWVPFEKLTEEAGLNWEAVLDKVPPDPSLYGRFFRIKEAIEAHLKPAVAARRSRADETEISSRLGEQEKLLLEFSNTDTGGIIEKLRSATASQDAESYARAWNWLTQLHRLKEPVARRNQLLERLSAVAPAWGDALRAHLHPHDQSEPPGDVDKAWLHRQCEQELKVRHRSDIDTLQEEVLRLKNQLRAATAHYVENKTWANQLRRTGVRQQQALVGWLDLMRKIGSGKGKRAPRLKAMAREKLGECRDAVPVWIMPMSRVAESYHPGESSFDVVILDEASQCEVTGLIAFALGKQVLVVGDHEQVSPEAVGLSYAAVEALIDEFLGDIPNKEVYDGRTSVYDLARQSFGGTIRLLEHFRCVPEIIAFSNSLCYQGEIQPLRECSQVRLRPPTVALQVEGGEYRRKVNLAEAETIASLVVAACEQPEYANATMGVISLVGEEQAAAVDKLLTKHLELAEYQERRIVCGNAAQFQGDERDVMFLSVVETANGTPLAMRASDVFTKRFNVAASRARDQMWVVHSLNPDEDLKEGDLREVLIRHATDPAPTLAHLQDQGQSPRASIEEDEAALRFELELKQALEARGFRVTSRFSVGNYRLDMVVEAANGRVAIKCDGAAEHVPQRLSQFMEREAVLERLGWRFLRIRASRYYLDPAAEVERVVERLTDMGLRPGGPAAPEVREAEADELRQRVIQRAAQLRDIWSGRVSADEVVPPTRPEPVESSLEETPETEEAPEPEETPVEASEEAPEPEETPVELAEEAPEPEETPVELAEETPEPEETPMEVAEETPGPEETPVEVAEEAPEPEETPEPEEEETVATRLQRRIAALSLENKSPDKPRKELSLSNWPAGKKPTDEAPKPPGRGLKGWRNLLPLQKTGNDEEKRRKSELFIPLDKDAPAEEES